MALNQNASYGRGILDKLTGKGAGRTYVVSAAIGTGNNAQRLQELFPTDQDGIVRVYSTITLALAACTAGYNETIVIATDYTTAPTDTELGSAGTKGVTIVYADQLEDSERIAMTSNLALPASTTGTLFNVVGVCEVIAIVGLVTTVIQAGANNMKLSTVSNSATTDICADLDVDGKLAQSRMSITGTFANAMINTAKGVPVARQATPIVVQQGTIIATTAATKTGNIRWSVLYRPLSLGARIYA